MITLVLFLGSASGWAATCPIQTELDPKLHTLSETTLLKLNPQWKQPEQVSGFTLTDFDSIQPWQTKPCESQFCVEPKTQKLVHHVYVRPEKLKGKKPNPRWRTPQEFPCGDKPHKNYVTYSCTVDHEKVHVIQRDDAIAAGCDQYVQDLKDIHASSAEEASKKAKDIYQKLIRKVFEADQEEGPYQIEWQCNSQKATKAGVQCQGRPDWKKLSFLKGLAQRETKKDQLDFLKGEEVVFSAKFLTGATQLKSMGPIDGCEQKTWYFSYQNLDQENCTLKDGNTRKVFYWFGKKQRDVIVTPRSEKVTDQLLIDPRRFIESDR